MKKCISCDKEIEDLYHQCPHCGGTTFIQSGSAEDQSSWYHSMAKQSEASKLVDKSVEFIMAGKYAEAETVLEKAIKINPYNATAYGNMGGVFHRQGRFEEAIPWFEKALKLNPDLEGVPEALKEVRTKIKKSKLITSSKQKPSRKAKIQHIESLFNEGTRLYSEKKFEEAEIKLKEALSLAPASEATMYNLALVYLEQQKYNLALELINKIEKIDCAEIIDILKEKGYTNIKGGIPVRWSNFYIYVRIPLGILFSISSFVEISKNFDKINLPFLYITLIIIAIILAIALFIGLHKRQLWGWKLNWFSLVFEVVTFPLDRSSNLNEYFIMSGFLIVIWFLPNYVYFKKRKTLFS